MVLALPLVGDDIPELTGGGSQRGPLQNSECPTSFANALTAGQVKGLGSTGIRSLCFSVLNRGCRFCWTSVVDQGPLLKAEGGFVEQVIAHRDMREEGSDRRWGGRCGVVTGLLTI